MKRDDGAGHGSVVKHWLTTEIHVVRNRTSKESLTDLGSGSTSNAKDTPWF